jgi:ATP-dependent DNA helicase PIF1
METQVIDDILQFAYELSKYVDIINDEALQMFHDDITEYKSTDSVENENDSYTYPHEFLHSIKLPGMSLYHLTLKKGCPLMLLRNLNIKKGLCNGTRLILLNASTNMLYVKILNGSNIGEIAFIPKIDIIPENSVLPFQIKRRQFPVSLAFAMTINKAQGQSLSKVGVYLPEPVFGHGQLYVALSRAGVASNTKIFIKQIDGKQGQFPGKTGFFTKNIVYREVLSV